MSGRHVLLLLAALAAAGCGGERRSEGSGTVAPPAAASTPAAAKGCRAVQAPEPAERSARKPKEPLDPKKRYSLVFETSCGTFAVALDPKRSPHAAASLVSLARAGYFDETQFHRIVPGFVIQGGDPTATGGGGPGYTTVDPPPANSVYAKGVVAMAKTATEPPGTAGSQFFVMTANAALPPDYAIVGKVVDGLGVVERIGGLGGPDESPTQPVVVRRVRVRVS